MTTIPLLLGSLLLLPAQVKDDDPEPPKPCPLSAKLVAKKRTYKLDFGGMTKEQYLTAARAGTATPVVVDLELVVTNNTRSDVRVRTVGTTTRLTLKLEGTGAVEAPPSKTAGKLKTTYVIIPPGQKMSIPITALASGGSRAKAKQGDKVHYWTEAGEYKLSASYYTMFYLDYKQGGKVKSTYLTLEAKPITLKVEK